MWLSRFRVHPLRAHLRCCHDIQSPSFEKGGHALNISFRAAPCIVRPTRGVGVCCVGYVPHNDTRPEATGQATCTECAPGLMCDTPGQTVSQVSLRAGYWRPSHESLQSYSCSPETACCGGVVNVTGFSEALCSEGHTGARCGSCAASWYKLGGAGATCQPCSRGMARGTEALLCLADLAVALVIPLAISRLLRSRLAAVRQSLDGGAVAQAPASVGSCDLQSPVELVRVPSPTQHISLRAVRGGGRTGHSPAFPGPC